MKRCAGIYRDDNIDMAKPRRWYRYIAQKKEEEEEEEKKNMPRRWTPPLQALYPKLIRTNTHRHTKTVQTGGALSHLNLLASVPMNQNKNIEILIFRTFWAKIQFLQIRQI